MFPRARGRLCVWHKCNRNLTDHTSFSKHLKSIEDKEAEMAEWHALVSWLHSFAHEPETEREANIMFGMLEQCMNEEQTHHRVALPPAMMADLKLFVAKGFQEVEAKMLAHHFHLLPCQDRASSQIVEVENSAVKASTSKLWAKL